jgi:hypothetical protein
VFVPVEDTDKVFMVKGSNTRDFLVYWVRQEEWHARRHLPGGLGAKNGTCLALLGGRLFCLKGGTTEFYEYLPESDSWIRRASIPDVGRSGQRKRPSRGAALTSDGGRFLYALKGGRVNEFWRYDVWRDTWVQLDDIPRGNNRRRVGTGGALAWLDGRVYALKGGGSSEFWCFDPLAAFAVVPKPGRDAVEAEVLRLPLTARAPTLLRCGRLAECPVPAHKTTILVLDVAGRIVARRTVAGGSIPLRFALPGIYFITPLGARAPVAKLVVLE